MINLLSTATSQVLSGASALASVGTTLVSTGLQGAQDAYNALKSGATKTHAVVSSALYELYYNPTAIPELIGAVHDIAESSVDQIAESLCAPVQSEVASKQKSALEPASTPQSLTVVQKKVAVSSDTVTKLIHFIGFLYLCLAYVTILFNFGKDRANTWYAQQMHLLSVPAHLLT